jgi:hypothetical protein
LTPLRRDRASGRWMRSRSRASRRRCKRMMRGVVDRKETVGACVLSEMNDNRPRRMMRLGHAKEASFRFGARMSEEARLARQAAVRAAQPSRAPAERRAATRSGHPMPRARRSPGSGMPRATDRSAGQDRSCRMESSGFRTRGGASARSTPTGSSRRDPWLAPASTRRSSASSSPGDSRKFRPMRRRWSRWRGGPLRTHWGPMHRGTMASTPRGRGR